MERKSPYHVPVLLQTSADALVLNPAGVYADLTFGGGGHSNAILQRLNSKGRLFAFDQDADTLRNAPQDPRFNFILSNFRFLSNWMHYYNIPQLDGIIADLGVSAHHLDDARRGFSFRSDAPLDMRMNTSARLTAADVVNTYPADSLARIFRTYGELKNAASLANRILAVRTQKSIDTTRQLADLVAPLLGYKNQKRQLARVFQALRIEVNQEMQALAQMLASAVGLLAPGARLVVLSYHSLEDRMVKNLIKTGNVEGIPNTDFFGRATRPLRAVNVKPIVPDAAEQQANPRSRSAKLRVAERQPDAR